MAKKTKAEVDSGVNICPGCKRKCLPFKAWPNGSFVAVHKIGTREVKGRYGFDYPVKVVEESCDETGPVIRS